MSAFGKALGKGPQITFEGKRYEVSPETYDMLAELPEVIEDHLLDKIRRKRGRLSDDQYAEQLDAMMRVLASCVLEPGNPEFDRAICTIEMRVYRIWRRLFEKDSTVTLELVRRMWREHWSELEKKAVQADHDPNPGRPETPASPSPSTPSAPSSSASPGT